MWEYEIGPHAKHGRIEELMETSLSYCLVSSFIEIVTKCKVETKAWECDVYLNDGGFTCGCIVSPGWSLTVQVAKQTVTELWVISTGPLALSSLLILNLDSGVGLYLRLFLFIIWDQPCYQSSADFSKRIFSFSHRQLVKCHWFRVFLLSLAVSN